MEQYIGDGVYASCEDGYHITLSLSDGFEIALEPDVFKNLLKYTRQLEHTVDRVGMWSGDKPADEKGD